MPDVPVVSSPGSQPKDTLQSLLCSAVPVCFTKHQRLSALVVHFPREEGEWLEMGNSEGQAVQAEDGGYLGDKASALACHRAPQL